MIPWRCVPNPCVPNRGVPKRFSWGTQCALAPPFSIFSGFSESILFTSGFLPRVRARALRAPVFLSSLPPQMGRCAPPAHCSSSTSYSFFFPLDHRGFKIWGPLSPAPIAALCYSLLFSFLLFNFFFFFSSYTSLLILLLGAILRLLILHLLYFKLFFVLQTCILLIYTYLSFWGVFRGGQAFFDPFGVRPYVLTFCLFYFFLFFSSYTGIFLFVSTTQLI